MTSTYGYEYLQQFNQRATELRREAAGASAAGRVVRQLRRQRVDLARREAAARSARLKMLSGHQNAS